MAFRSCIKFGGRSTVADFPHYFEQRPFSYPGRTFDLTALKLFGYYFGNPRAAGKTLQYNILAYHPGNATPVVVTFTIKSLAYPVTKTWNDPRLQGLDKAVIQFAPNVGKTYFIETTFRLN
jgi:hypothetical protein